MARSPMEPPESDGMRNIRRDVIRSRCDLNIRLVAAPSRDALWVSASARVVT